MKKSKPELRAPMSQMTMRRDNKPTHYMQYLSSRRRKGNQTQSAVDLKVSGSGNFQLPSKKELPAKLFEIQPTETTARVLTINSGLKTDRKVASGSTRRIVDSRLSTRIKPNQGSETIDAIKEQYKTIDNTLTPARVYVNIGQNIKSLPTINPKANSVTNLLEK